MAPRAQSPERTREVQDLDRPRTIPGYPEDEELDGLRMQAAMQEVQRLRSADQWLKHKDVIDFLEISDGLSQRKKDAFLKWAVRAPYFENQLPDSTLLQCPGALWGLLFE